MRSQFCQLTSVLFASLSLVAMAVGLLAFASTALASDPVAPIDPGVVLAGKCGSCVNAPTCPGTPCTSRGTATCAGGSKLCPDCTCLPVVGTLGKCECQ